MHQEHNVAESIISMCFDVTGFSKDISDLCNCPSIEPNVNAKGNLKRTHAPYCPKLAERKEILGGLRN
jgi:hypothetical protein